MFPRALLCPICDEIHSFREFAGVRIGLDDGCQSELIHHGDSTSPNYDEVVVIIEIVGDPLPTAAQPALQRGGRRAGRAVPPPTVLGEPPAVITNRSRIGREVIGGVVSCGVMVASAWAVGGGAAAAVPSGGLSTALIVVGYVGLVSSSVACVNSLGRVGVAMVEPDSNSLQVLDRDYDYSMFIWINDIVGVTTAVVAAPVAFVRISRLLRARRAFPSADALRGMTRRQRMSTIEEGLRSLGPGERQAAREALRESGFGESQINRLLGTRPGLPRSLQRSGATRRLTEVMSESRAVLLNESIRDLVIAAAGVTGSALPHHISGSSGVANYVIVHAMRVGDDES